MTLASFLLIFGGIGAALIALAVQRRYRRPQSLARGLLISYFVIFFALAIGELYLRYGYADSRMEFGLYGQNWSARYVQKNSLGYRDREWTPEELAAKTTIFALGDSFTEGWGLNNPADRYTDVLQNHLGDDYAIVTIANAGQATYHQTQNFMNYPYKTPDIVIWQYFLNDIEVAAKSNGMNWDYEVPPAPPIVDESYLASFIYWRTNYEKLFHNVNDGRNEWQYNYAAYDDAYIWDIHRQEIDTLVREIEASGARLIVVIFPNMLDPLGSVPYVDRVAQELEAQGVTEILKLTDEVAAWTVAERVVSNYDSHASVAFNHRVGDMIYTQFFAGE